MAFNNDKLKPSYDLRALALPVVFDSVRSTSEHTTTRKRQCYKCMQNIEKGERYINHQFKYDKKIITVSFHTFCFNVD